MISLSVWQGRSAETAELLAAFEGGPLPISATVVAYLWRGGEEQKARDYYASHPLDLDTDDWFSHAGLVQHRRVGALHGGRRPRRRAPTPGSRRTPG